MFHITINDKKGIHTHQSGTLLFMLTVKDNSPAVVYQARLTCRPLIQDVKLAQNYIQLPSMPPKPTRNQITLLIITASIAMMKTSVHLVQGVSQVSVCDSYHVTSLSDIQNH